MALYACSSREWHCDACGKRNVESLPDPVAGEGTTTNGGHTHAHSQEQERIKDASPVSLRAEKAAPVPSPTRAPDSAQERSSTAVEERSAGVALASEPPAPLPVPMPPHMPAATQAASSASVAVPPSGRPLLLLDTAICVFIVLILALLAKRVL